MIIHVADETLGTLGKLINIIEQIKQGFMQIGDAVDLQRGRMQLKRQSAEDDCRKIAAVNWQSCVARKCRAQLHVGSTTKPYIYVRHCCCSRMTVDRKKPCHVRVSEDF
jgi:hypothetical protein